jgi:hypothetical protein
MSAMTSTSKLSNVECSEAVDDRWPVSEQVTFRGIQVVQFGLTAECEGVPPRNT